MKKAKIYKPAKTSMQSGRAKTKKWHLRFDDIKSGINPLMGWESSTNTMSEINLEFLPVTPAFENTNISLIQQFIKQNQFRPGHVVIVDTPAGSSQRLWNLVAEG